jgi:hypothetical protein
MKKKMTRVTKKNPNIPIIIAPTFKFETQARFVSDFLNSAKIIVEMNAPPKTH